MVAGERDGSYWETRERDDERENWINKGFKTKIIIKYWYGLATVSGINSLIL